MKSVKTLAAALFASLLFSYQSAAKPALTPGEYQPGADPERWTWQPNGGYITVTGEDSRVLLLEAREPNQTPFVYTQLSEPPSGSHYEITLYTRNTTTGASLFAGESPLPPSSESQHIHRGSGDGELDEIRLTFAPRDLPAYVGFGILNDTGSMWVDALIIREVVLNEDESGSARVLPRRDMSREQGLFYALNRYANASTQALANPQVSASVQRHIQASTSHARDLARKLQSQEIDSPEADAALGKLERIIVIFQDEINPDYIKLENNQNTATLTLLNLFSNTSVWARIEPDLPTVTLKQQVPGTPHSFTLNDGNLINLPPGEPATLLISGLKSGASVTLYPLDHFASDVHTTISFARHPHDQE